MYPVPVRCPPKGGTLLAPLFPPPRPSQEDRGITRAIAKEKQRKVKGKSPRTPTLPQRKEGVGRKSGCSPPPAPSSSASCRRSSSLSLRSRSSHSDASLCASSSTKAKTNLPTSVVEKKSSTARLHLSSPKRPHIFQRFFHLLVSLLTSA
jgi:hypothetical protein